MTEREILEEVREVLREHLQVGGEVGLESDLTRDLELDSLKQLTFVVELENRFKICFDPSDEGGVRTVKDVVALVAEKTVGR